jgi:hypothetical protein
MAGDNTMRAPTAITFHAGQRVVCVDASPNRRCGLKLLARGKIYIIRAIEQKPGWEAPGWGVHLEGIHIVHPDVDWEWAMRPTRFRPVVNRPTNIEIFKRLLAGVPPKEPPQQLRLPQPNLPR